MMKDHATLALSPETSKYVNRMFGAAGKLTVMGRREG